MRKLCPFRCCSNGDCDACDQPTHKNSEYCLKHLQQVIYQTDEEIKGLKVHVDELVIQLARLEAEE